MATAVKEPTTTDPFDAERADNEPKGQDADKGKLFDVPKVVLDTTQPTALRLAFSGSIPIGFDEREWVEFYNQLASGKRATLTVTVHVAGTKTSHRRDNEGHVDAVVQTKSLIVTDVHRDA